MSKALQIVGLAVVLCSLATASQAQIGEGWTEYYPSKTIHLDDADGLHTYPWSPYRANDYCDYSFDSDTGIETFRIWDPRSNRSEIRLNNNYTSGQRQFEGWVLVSPPTNDESVMQVFGAVGSATALMIRAFSANGGELRRYSGTVLASGIYDVWTRVNVIHDANNNTLEVYVDGELKWSGADRGDATHYFKYGCYGTMRTGYAQVEWWGTRFFRK